jgi:hypothetical protein
MSVRLQHTCGDEAPTHLTGRLCRASDEVVPPLSAPA